MIQLHKGDCLEIMPTIPDKSVDMILADLPYGTTACKWDSVIDLNLLWVQYKRIIKKNGVVVLFAAQPFTTTLISSNIGNYRYSWIWNKNRGSNFQQVKKQPLRYTEDICVFSYHQHSYYPIMVKRNKLKDYSNCKTIRRNNKNINHFNSDETKLNRILTHGYPNNIIEISSQSSECNNTIRLHPTQKPIELIEYLIKTYTKENELVIDNTMGSGTTGVACVNTGRNFIGIEMDDDYFDIAKDRIYSVKNPNGFVKPEVGGQINLWSNL